MDGSRLRAAWVCACVRVARKSVHVKSAAPLIGHFYLSAPVCTGERLAFYGLLCVIENTKGSVTSCHVSSCLL